MKTPKEWEEAAECLDARIGSYDEIDPTRGYGYYRNLYLLKRRVKSGERTDELWNEIMACK